eukprot:353414-Chlamydomonas_euryale.AAC.15
MDGWMDGPQACAWDGSRRIRLRWRILESMMYTSPGVKSCPVPGMVAPWEACPVMTQEEQLECRLIVAASQMSKKNYALVEWGWCHWCPAEQRNV